MLSLIHRVRDEAMQLTHAGPASGFEPDSRANNNVFDVFCADNPVVYPRNCVAQELLPDDRLQIHCIDGKSAHVLLCRRCIASF